MFGARVALQSRNRRRVATFNGNTPHRMSHRTLIILLLAATACGGHAQVATAGCAPLETRDPNASGQRPAFAGQTRACGIRASAVA